VLVGSLVVGLSGFGTNYGRYSFLFINQIDWC